MLVSKFFLQDLPMEIATLFWQFTISYEAVFRFFLQLRYLKIHIIAGRMVLQNVNLVLGTHNRYDSSKSSTYKVKRWICKPNLYCHFLLHYVSLIYSIIVKDNDKLKGQ